MRVHRETTDDRRTLPCKRIGLFAIFACVRKKPERFLFVSLYIYIKKYTRGFSGTKRATAKSVPKLPNFDQKKKKRRVSVSLGNC